MSSLKSISGYDCNRSNTESVNYRTFHTNHVGGAGKLTILAAILIAAAVHLAFFRFAQDYRLGAFQRPELMPPPPAFELRRTEVDAGLLDPARTPEERPAAKPLDQIGEIVLPDEEVGFEEGSRDIRATPAVAQIESPVFSETPAVAPPRFSDAISDVRAGSTREAQEKIGDLEEQLLAQTDQDLANPNAPQLLDPSTLGQQARREGDMAGQSAVGSGGDVGPGSFSNLDELLNRAGPVRQGTAPILMPTDLLFDYDQFLLRRDAVESLRKLGTLIQRNPQARFIIEGHTDAFGPDDYNLWLSTQRALAVRDWLIKSMGIDPRQIETIGYGKRRLLVPPDRGVEQQQLNRRVEIVIQPRR